MTKDKNKERTQLNINIDPELLLCLKSEAIKAGKTLTDFVIDKLQESTSESSERMLSLESRLLKIEQFLSLEDRYSPREKEIGVIFTNEGAKAYGETAKAVFDSYIKKEGLTVKDGLAKLAVCLNSYPHSNPELVFQILLGNHALTGLEMTKAYRTGSCAMRSALNDMTNNQNEILNEAFLQAVITRQLV